MIEKALLSVTVVLSFEEKMKTDAIRDTSALSLPPPLTHTALNEAYSQLCPVANGGALTNFQVATVKSFAGSSAALQTISSEKYIAIHMLSTFTQHIKFLTQHIMKL